MDASITLAGNVGTDVEFNSGEGWAFARFRLATTPRFRRNGEWVDGETTWVNVSISGRSAENVRASVAKGDPLIVVGRLRTHTWDSEGVKHDRLVVEATAVGHDLSRGTTLFTRPERPRPEVIEEDEHQIDEREPELASSLG